MSKLTVILFVMVVAFGLFASTASAAMPNLDFNIWQGTGQNGITCNESSYSSSTGSSGQVGCSFCDGVIVMANIVNNIAVPLGIIAAVAFIIYGALRMMVSFGSESNFGAAKKVMTSAVIGLVIILCGWLIVNTFFHLLTGPINFPWSQIKC